MRARYLGSVYLPIWRDINCQELIAIVDGSKTYQFYTVHMAEAFEDLQFGHETFYIFLLPAKCLLSSKGFPGVFTVAQKTYELCQWYRSLLSPV
jgi:hypothetical protein